MNNLRKFNWITQYNSAKEGEELVKPSVSLVNDKAVVIYDEDKPTPPKFMATYNDGRTYKLECDGNPTLSTGDTRPSGYDYREMTSAAIGDYCVTSIGSTAFNGCINLTSCTIGSGVTSIGDYVFQSCSGLTSIIIPNSVETIGVSAFGFCTRLTSVTIGSNVISIGRSAFNEARIVKYLTSYAITPPALGDFAFYSLRYSVLDVYVPDVSVNTYKSDSGWGVFGSRIKPISQKPS